METKYIALIVHVVITLIVFIYTMNDRDSDADDVALATCLWPVMIAAGPFIILYNSPKYIKRYKKRQLDKVYKKQQEIEKQKKLEEWKVDFKS